MDKTTSGWVIFIVSLGMMCGLLSSDVGKLTAWSEAFNPSFIAIIMSHFASVVLAFTGGKMIPTHVDRTGMQTRSTDSKS